MKKQLSVRELAILLLLLVICVGIAYRIFFFIPLQEELAAISTQSEALDAQILQAAEKAADMEAMRSELDEMFTGAVSEPPEIPPYDNRDGVLRQLNLVLQQSEEYSLQFSEPVMDTEGTVRRNVTMTVHCTSFAAAKTIIQDLSDSPWRCLITNLSITGNGNLLDGPVQISATITFLESTKLAP